MNFGLAAWQATRCGIISIAPFSKKKCCVHLYCTVEKGTTPTHLTRIKVDCNFFILTNRALSSSSGLCYIMWNKRTGLFLTFLSSSYEWFPMCISVCTCPASWKPCWWLTRHVEFIVKVSLNIHHIMSWKSSKSLSTMSFTGFYCRWLERHVSLTDNCFRMPGDLPKSYAQNMKRSWGQCGSRCRLLFCEFNSGDPHFTLCTELLRSNFQVSPAVLKSRTSVSFIKKKKNLYLVSNKPEKLLW